MKRELTAIILVLLLLLTACNTTRPTTELTSSQSEPPKDIVVLYTNDVHCGVDDGIGYRGLATLKDAMEDAGNHVLLVDAGDAVQGDTIGTLSNGEYIIDIMNRLGYDAAIPGNHEFDYGMEQFFALTERAEFPYLSANFTGPDGKPALDAYTILDIGGVKVAFVGISTPKTIVSSTPAYFQDENGKYIYGFLQDKSGELLYNAIQSAVNAARDEGARYVIALAHLGTEAECSPWTSSEVIANTSGIDVMLDGHSHSVIEGDLVKNKAGADVVLTSTGTKLANVGCLTIGADGQITTSLINDNGIGDFIDTIQAEYEELVNKVVAITDVNLTISDPTAVSEDGKPVRIIRTRETNLGDLCADAYRAVSGADIAFVNGGGIRANIAAGKITYGNIISVHPYGNEMCVVEATGQEILDALELGASGLPGESGGFLQVSGLTYDIDLLVPTSVKLDENGMFLSVNGDYRVKNVTVGGRPLDKAATYTLASHNYMIKNAGDGFTMFRDNVLLQDSVMLDNQVLINYIIETLDGVVGKAYAEPYGEGRITIID